MSEPWRPQWHFSARRNWINDPNGLIWHAGEWHLFFQYNPFGAQWGHMSWGHAVSTDLLNWQELPVAIPEDERASVFSGSVVLDRHNSSGLGDDSEPPLVAIYTACLRRPEGGQAQELAYSRDRGRTWQRYGGNPVLDLGLRDFRDPKVFWHEPTQRWVMVVVVPDDRKAQFYASHNLRQWSLLSEFAAPFEGQGIWECPDLMALGRHEGCDRWLLKVDALQGHPGGDAGARLFFGQFDGHTFTAEPEDAPRWADGGNDFYAALSWAQVPDGRAIWLAWMNNHRVAKHLPTEPFRGSMSVPRELRLRQHAGRWQLLQQPVRELQALRGAGRTRLAVDVGSTPLDLQPLLPTQGDVRLLDIELTVRSPVPGQRLQVLLRWGGPAAPEQGLQVLLDVAEDGSGLLSVDRSRAGLQPGGDSLWPQRRHAPERLAPAPTWRLRLLLDTASVEVFGGEGEAVVTEQFLPEASHTGLALVASAVPVRCDATVTPLRAAHIT